MKKLIFLFAVVSLLTACSIEDEPNILFVPAEVVETNLPESFTLGENFVVEVTYLLPSACHSAAGLQVTTGVEQDETLRDIYITGVASIEEGLKCTTQSDNLERKSSFRIIIEESEPYTFYLWTGLDENDENVFTSIVVPVEEPGTEG